MLRKITLTLLTMCATAWPSESQTRNYDAIFGKERLVKNACHGDDSYDHIDHTDLRTVANNLLPYQNPDGGWPVNIDWLDASPASQVMAAVEEKHRVSALDNKNVCMHIELLAEAYKEYRDDAYKTAVTRGIAYILNSQMENGGWHSSHSGDISFNGYIMSACIKTMYVISRGEEPFDWVQKSIRKK